ncbi:MAG: thiamine-phosphate synthase family protein, partial [Halorubrum sp.]
RAMVPGEPEFGVSEHVATVLLAAREAGADVRGAVNLRYDPETVETLAADHPTVEFDAERPTREAVADAVAGADLPADEEGETFVVYQTGAVGVEPIVYVLAPTAVEAARTVRRLL